MLIPQLVTDVKAHDKLLNKHGEVLAGIRGWTAGAAAVGAVAGGIIVALISKLLGT